MKKILIYFFVLSSWHISAQDFDPPLRLELDMADAKSMNMELLGKNGLVLFFQKDAKDETKWTVCHYDTNFQLVKTRSVPFEEKTTLSATAADGHFFYAILQNDAATTTNAVNTYILRYDVQTLKIDIFSFYHAEKGKILSIARCGDIFVYSTYNPKSEEKLYVFNTEKLSVNTLYSDRPLSCEFQDAYLDTVSQSLWVISKFYENKKQTAVRVTQLNGKGDVLQEFSILSEERYQINSCRVIHTSGNGNLLLLGNYLDNEDDKHSTKNNNSGIFTLRIKNGISDKMLLIDYATLENWYVLNKKQLSYCYDMLYFVAQDDSTVLIASDFYMPEYQQEYYTTGMGYYPVAPVESRLLGFKYQTACILNLDKEGKLLWYTSLNYSDLMLKSVRPMLSGYIDGETGEELYLFGFNNKIYSLIYNKTEIVQSIKSIRIQPLSRFENINTSEKTQCRHWYGNNFVCFAYQQISKKNATTSRKNNKYVFGINKLTYR